MHSSVDERPLAELGGDGGGAAESTGASRDRKPRAAAHDSSQALNRLELVGAVRIRAAGVARADAALPALLC